MIENINETVIVEKMTYVTHIVNIVHHFNATPCALLTYSLRVAYKRQYAKKTMSYAAHYGIRRSS